VQPNQINRPAENCSACEAAHTSRTSLREQNGQGIPKRDHVIVVAPEKANDLQLYEVPKLTNASPAAGGTRFSLSYLKQLGVDALWRKPIHPRGIDGRQIDPATNRPFELGSPYAVKNYFAVMPLMASGFTPGSSPAANDTPQGRAAAPRTIWAGCGGC
jgi:hypothetical protein